MDGEGAAVAGRHVDDQRRPDRAGRLHGVREDVDVAAVEEVEPLTAGDELLVVGVPVGGVEQGRHARRAAELHGGDAFFRGDVGHGVVGTYVNRHRRGRERELFRQDPSLCVPDQKRGIGRFDQRRSSEGEAAGDGAARLR